jgi:type I restriction enzyme R subunit
MEKGKIMPLSEADTCRIHITPKLKEAGWKDDQIAQERTFTDGRIIVVGRKCKRGRQKRADYILKYRHDFPIAVVEAKAENKLAADGLQQAKEYAEILKLKFAYATNGHEIIEHDFITGKDTTIYEYPSPDDLWLKLCADEEINPDDHAVTQRILTPTRRLPGKRPRYYQEIAINKVVQAITQGRKRVLLTMATGTGKTFVAFQIIWKLWSSRWNKEGSHRKPRVLFLSDRTVLIDDPYIKDFAVFGDARHRIKGEAKKSREIYFATYQSIARDAVRPGLFKDYDSDFFDLIVVDECHRGSARDDSNWREILSYFKSAYQLGMTATPLREDNRDTYHYFGNPIFTYSLKQGIEDGFLAPYRVHRIITTVDAEGWRPSRDQVDKYGEKIPDRVYHTEDFEREVSLKARTETVAKHLTKYLNETDRFAKTIVFCVDQEHAEQMRMALNNLNADLVKENPDYVCRIVSDEGEVGKGHLSNFMELETETPTIVTTSKLLTTGVDIQLCKNIVIFRIINSMVEFKQTIGRGTRVRDDYGKLFFDILDYTGSATKNFADPDFDGFPALEEEQIIDENGNVIDEDEREQSPEDQAGEDIEWEPDISSIIDDERTPRRKYYVENGSVEIAVDHVYVLNLDGDVLRVTSFTDYTADVVRKMYTMSSKLRRKWTDRQQRTEIINALERQGIALSYLLDVTEMHAADPFDLLCHIAFNAPLRSRRERADRVRNEESSFFEQFQPKARQILLDILSKYEQHGVDELTNPRVFETPPLSRYGKLGEIARLFGNAKKMLSALNLLQNLIYSL